MLLFYQKNIKKRCFCYKNFLLMVAMPITELTIQSDQEKSHLDKAFKVI